MVFPPEIAISTVFRPQMAISMVFRPQVAISIPAVGAESARAGGSRTIAG